MMENIESIKSLSLQVLDRGEKIELLVDKTENLRSQAQDFRTQGTKMRKGCGCRNEDKADCSCHYRGLDPDHSFISLWWIQMPLVCVE
ncbi:UNVERIFIED_CONTAM: putative vesicle-associated membrane protein [Sesamum radiatum]|uniref:Vesicle-associated membrane protein n=1 Tax=Sesamum radiatum TaxID=300843 RepID=A0AAW2W969_SESRA